MAEQMRQGYCEECQKYTLVKRRGVSHVLHLLLSIFTIGLWVIVWMLLAMLNVGGWRCQTCGSNRIKDTGELLGFRGWLLLFLAATFVFPTVILFSGSDPDESSRTLQTLSPLLVWVPIVAIPVLAVLAIRRRSRERARIAQPRQVPDAEPVPTPAPRVVEPPKSPSLEDDAPPGMTVSEEYIERAEPDTDAAADFRRRMRQQN